MSIGQINNNESGLSVRGKLNNVINRVNEDLVIVKGNLNDESELPISGEIGDGYFIDNILYIYDGSVWNSQKGDDGESGNDLNAVALGNISGSTEINLNLGNTFTGNLTSPITLSFTNVPTGGTGIVLVFTSIEQITWPSGANATDGEIKDASGGRYKYIVTVRTDDDYDVDGLIDNLQSVT